MWLTQGVCDGPAAPRTGGCNKPPPIEAPPQITTPPPNRRPPRPQKNPNNSLPPPRAPTRAPAHSTKIPPKMERVKKGKLTIPCRKQALRGKKLIFESLDHRKSPNIQNVQTSKNVFSTFVLRFSTPFDPPDWPLLPFDRGKQGCPNRTHPCPNSSPGGF